MAESFLPNSNISHYRIVSKLGAGGMGEVYLAQDSKLDRKVAIKFLGGARSAAAICQDRSADGSIAKRSAISRVAQEHAVSGVISGLGAVARLSRRAPRWRRAPKLKG